MNPTPLIVRPTLCKICGQKFEGNSLNSAAIIGENAQAKIQQIQALISPLMKHLTKKHPQQLQWAQLMGGEWGGLLSLNFFQCDEPTIERQRDETRWKINQMTRRVAITDERIKERLLTAVIEAFTKDAKRVESREELPADELEEIKARAEIWMGHELAREITKTMQKMRDVLEERGRYPAPAMNGTPVMNAAGNAPKPPAAD